MKKLLYLTCSLATLTMLPSCKDKDTTVSKGVFSGNTVVSHKNAKGNYTRTEYGKNLWGDSTTKVSRGHSNATEKDDLVILGLGIGLVILNELFSD